MTAQRIGTDLARGAAGDIGFAWALGLGIGLLAFGLLGFVPNPLVGAPSAAWGTPVFVTGDAHDVLNLVAGAIVLYGALGLTGRRRGGLLIVAGVIGLVLFLVGLVSGTAFGLLAYPVNLPDQLLLLVVGGVSIAVGYLARGGTLRRPHGGELTATDA
jgi:hypothetical protein